MTPIDISLVAMLMLGVFTFVALTYQAYRDTQTMRQWWADYQLRMTELDQRFKNRVPLEQLLKQYNESGEVAKRPRAEGDMSSLEERDNVVLLNVVNEEQR